MELSEIVSALGDGAVLKRENRMAEAAVLEGVDGGAFEKALSHLSEIGFSLREERREGDRSFAALSLGGDAVFLNWFGGTRELYAVLEKDTRYFDFADKARPVLTSPTLTQIELEDFGMSYVLRLSDGRFIVFDGGRDFAPDAKRLYDCLCQGANGERPTIAAWILTHPHSDHFHLLVGFTETYGELVTVERFLYLFPEHDDLEQFPLLARANSRFDYDDSSLAYIPKMKAAIERYGAEIFTPHTGQRYVIGDATLEVLASMDDTIFFSGQINPTSLVFRIAIAGQILLFAADASCSVAKLAQKYGSYLKSDLLQVPHHGFQSGDPDAEIAAYRLIRPSVCLLPVSEHNAYTVFCIHRRSTRYLMTELGIDELIVGDPTHTLSLPYTADPMGRAKLRERVLRGLDATGSRAWVFSGLDTSREEDFVFTLLNLTKEELAVDVELFFETVEEMVRHIRIPLPTCAVKRLSIIGEEVDPDALYFNWLSLKKKGIPEDSLFAVRFTAEQPIIVTHACHAPAYVAQNRL